MRTAAFLVVAALSLLPMNRKTCLIECRRAYVRCVELAPDAAEVERCGRDLPRCEGRCSDVALNGSRRPRSAHTR